MAFGRLAGHGSTCTLQLRLTAISNNVTAIPSLQYALAILATQKAALVAELPVNTALLEGSNAIDALDGAITDLTIVLGDLRMANYRATRAAQETAAHAS